MPTSIRDTLYAYAKHDSPSHMPSDFSLRCIVGMVQTGEATESDIRFVFRPDVADHILTLAKKECHVD